MKILHFLYTEENSLCVFRPEEVVFGCVVRSGRMRLKHSADFCRISEISRLWCKSFISDHVCMVRQIEVNTADFRNRLVFFQYHEPIPYEVVNLYKHKIVSSLMHHFSMEAVIDGLNYLLEQDKSEFNGMYLDWVEQIMGSFSLSDGNHEEESTRIKSFLNLFANHYITNLYGRVYSRKMPILKNHAPMLVFKMYEMKDLHDRGLVSIL